MIKNKFTNNNGSFCIEASIVIPIVFVILFTIIWQMQVLRTNMHYKSIFIKESEKSSIYGQFYEYIDYGNDLMFNNALDDDLYELAFTSLYEELFINSLEKHLIEQLNNNSRLNLFIKNHNITTEKDLFGDGIYLTSQYEISTPLGIKNNYFTIPLRLWANGDNSGKSIQKSVESIWEADNFTRGRILRRRFGGNLPFGFPVLSGFQNNCALIIKSMDLNTPTWQSPDAVYKKLKSDIDNLVNYKGTNGDWGKDKINIRNDQIFARNIKFIFPEDIEYSKYTSVFDHIELYSKTKSIIVDYIFYQNSNFINKNIID